MKRLILIICILFSSVFLQEKAVEIKPPRGYYNYTFIKWAVSLGWLELVNTKPAIPNTIAASQDIIYKKTDQRQLKLDIFKNKSLSKPAPLIIFIHGGSWTKGDKKDYFAYCLPYAEKGYVTASLSYRFSQEAIFPAALEDIICGIRWLKKHSDEYGIDSSRVALVGGSAGGHLAMMAAYTADEPIFNSDCDDSDISTTVQAIVNIYGPSDLTTDFAISQSATPKFMGTTFDENPNKYKEASPFIYISNNDPPTLIFHGTIDKIVPVAQSDFLAKELKKYNVYHEYHRLKGWPHTMDVAVPVNIYTQLVMDRFFQKWLRGDNN
ncbi:MAG: alpha/beta hydrolase [Candidatus Marinimicrobia bacterium]|jgi:acetyl esterase/lipase|nr:alpha/beta hydrolase [Candidatus Neomarinimicrobiota bacterium]MBT4065341.1 alpha/beta hydrolase [Candidatus Neomarinimicrobiota bacterium]MBT4306914.1 alpha/beta hydrolase [Candidatus Neomarinimicrobiota bacterium]MBT4453932.1 alpha/beta hydrolase [Candidatus Neomarinimicrobiota bacterium]MBT4736919.1 alpha/beta hydrolase [Candidatus Neomarinimicrobiota bacterium]